MKHFLPRNISQQNEGFLMGGIGVLCFSFTLPATRLADSLLGGTFVGLGRALAAALLAMCVLFIRHESPPDRRHWRGLVIVAFGVVVGFPLFSSLALQSLPASHGAVVTGLLPAATAVMAVLRAGERPSKMFWISCIAGALAVLLFAVSQGAGHFQPGDMLLFVAVLLGGLGYAEGGRLAREMRGWRVICWALVIAAPFLVFPVIFSFHPHGNIAQPAAWFGFAYVSVVSSFLGFFAWYRGLALGGVARIGQIQLLQPVLTLFWAALLLHEHVTLLTVLASLLVIASAAVSQWTHKPRTSQEIPSHESSRL